MEAPAAGPDNDIDEHHRPLQEGESSLEPPTVLFSNNHLLVVNKPAGWPSVPNDPNQTIQHTYHNHDHVAKCVVSYCQGQQWGGGSQKRFLLPLHRVDQPCTGVLMLGKTKKAARRIQTKWSLVQKEYYCVVYRDLVENLMERSTKQPMAETTTTFHDSRVHLATTTIAEEEGITEYAYKLSGLLQPRGHRFQKTVVMTPLLSDQEDDNEDDEPITIFDRGSPKQTTSKKGDPQPCSLQWSLLQENNSYAMLRITTNQGRRHMIRALLAQVGQCPIVGDLRYSNNNDYNDKGNHNDNNHHWKTRMGQPLPDRSVALHAAHMTLPTTLKLGEPRLVEGSKERSSLLAGATFSAPIPPLWNDCFSFCDE